MTKKSREILEFVQSLEMHELGGDQEGVLLQSDVESSYGGVNNKCLNYSYASCSSDMNYFCSNSVVAACKDSKNTGGCTNGNGTGGGLRANVGDAAIDKGFSGILGI